MLSKRNYSKIANLFSLLHRRPLLGRGPLGENWCW